MKTKYEAYEIGSEVYGISEQLSSTGEKSTYHYAIFPAIVDSVTFAMNKRNKKIDVFYWLNTPSGEPWGDEVSAKEVSDSFEELANYLKEIWTEHASFD